MKLIHLSDLHFLGHWPEGQGVVLREYFNDLEKNVSIDDETYLVFSGDIFRSTPDSDLQTQLSSDFCDELNEIGIGKEKRIFVPGNHEIDQEFIKANIDTFEGFRSLDFDEHRFNDWVRHRYDDFIQPKFQNYISFQEQFGGLGCNPEFATGKGHSLTEQIGIYCLNTAITSVAGVEGLDGNKLDDKRHLHIETRGLNQWIQSTSFERRIMVMHHPVHWLSPWSQKELKILLKKHFDLVFCGHVHEPDLETLLFNEGQCSIITAPPLFTSKWDPLGYSIVELDVAMGIQITYRQWAPGHVFVPGVSIVNNETGVQCLSKGKVEQMSDDGKKSNPSHDRSVEMIEKYLESELDNALRCYTALDPIWIDIDVATHPEFLNDQDDTAIISSLQLAERPGDCIVKAMPQFGLSCLGRYIALTSWRRGEGDFVLCVSSTNLPNHEKGIRE